VEFARTREFTGDIVRVADVPMPFYNHDQTFRGRHVVLALPAWCAKAGVVSDSGRCDRFA